MNSCLYTGTVKHRRSRPNLHAFRYRVFMCYLDLDELAEVARTVWLFSVNRFNLVSFHDRDHMDRRAGATKAKVMAFVRRMGVELPEDGTVSLLTSCRIFGYVFNPISLYYCHERTGALRAVVAEVGNTFGEQHLYLLNTPLSTPHAPDTPTPAGTMRYQARKAMYVSPFISMDAVYDFHLAPVGDTLAVGIVEHEAGVHVLDAQLWGRRVPLTTATLSRVLLTYPLMTLTTVAAIHGEALRLYLKRAPLHRQPEPSVEQRAQQALLAELRTRETAD